MWQLILFLNLIVWGEARKLVKCISVWNLEAVFSEDWLVSWGTEWEIVPFSAGLSSILKPRQTRGYGLRLQVQTQKKPGQLYYFIFQAHINL